MVNSNWVNKTWESFFIVFKKMAWLCIIISFILVRLAYLCKVHHASWLPSKATFLNDSGNNLYKISLIVCEVWSILLTKIRRSLLKKKCLAGCYPPKWWLYVSFKILICVHIIFKNNSMILLFLDGLSLRLFVRIELRSAPECFFPHLYRSEPSFTLDIHLNYLILF